MLHPNIYFKKCLPLANGQFLKHIIDLKQIKQENITSENIMETTTNNIMTTALYKCPLS